MENKTQVMMALLDQYTQWEDLLASLPESRLLSPLTPSPWSPKDVIAHLNAWQERTVARLEAASRDQAPVFPAWLPGYDPEIEANTDQVNTWIFENRQHLPWETVHQDWRECFLKVLELGEAFSGQDLLDVSRYTWLPGIPLIACLQGTWDHHQEHYADLVAWLNAHPIK